MKIVAKAILIDKDNNYLLMRRSDHPTFPNDPDLPGGTLEEGEDPQQAMLREVDEEIGVALSEDQLHEIYQGNSYSAHGTMYHLYTARVDERPEIVMSWEHASYEWLSPEQFVAQAGNAKDTYMHMVHDVMKQSL